MKFGQFMNPSSAQNSLYRDVVQCFKKYDSWHQMIFYCKPYCKVQNMSDKKEKNQNYQDTISKPTFLAQDKMKDKEVFLNGEVNLMDYRRYQNNRCPQLVLNSCQQDFLKSRVRKMIKGGKFRYSKLQSFF